MFQIQNGITLTNGVVVGGIQIKYQPDLKQIGRPDCVQTIVILRIAILRYNINAVSDDSFYAYIPTVSGSRLPLLHLA